MPTSDQVVMENNSELDEDNDEMKGISEGPPSPLSPKQSYANKNDDDTDLDSLCEDNHTELQKNT